MIRAQYHPFWHGLLNWYGRREIHRHFRQVDERGRIHPDPNRSMLVLGNHFSWWDGFFISDRNHRRWHKRFHVMMLEEELARRKFLTKGGCYSVKKGSRDLIHSLNYSAELLGNPENLVLIFPQGRIQSQQIGQIEFEPGLGRILEKAAGPFQLVFSVLLTDYLSEKKPMARHFVKEVIWQKGLSVADLQENYRQFYRECKKAHIELVEKEVTG
ncbi:MAG: 1-acyl-sn-glycerol-3-phosphate acyltransferase [Bacteroidia bacterium]|nr:1-acyl-sn-glycerol-3-phosphate acyltransferase [Bacteroidia bacterium]